jgi:branched-subunit amino acid transport protein
MAPSTVIEQFPLAGIAAILVGVRKNALLVIATGMIILLLLMRFFPINT